MKTPFLTWFLLVMGILLCITSVIVFELGGDITIRTTHGSDYLEINRHDMAYIVKGIILFVGAVGCFIGAGLVLGFHSLEEKLYTKKPDL